MIGLATDAVGRPVGLPEEAPRVLVAGASGMGKTEALRTLAVRTLQTIGGSLVIIDPKQVGYLGLASVADVLSDPADFLPALLEVERLIERRYYEMAKLGTDVCREPPMLLLIDEIASVTQAHDATKQQRDEAARLVAEVAAKGRQANVGLAVGCQSADAASLGSTGVRSNLVSTVALRCTGTQAELVAAGDETCKPEALVLGPGDAFIRSAATRWRFARARIDRIDVQREAAALVAKGLKPAKLLG